MDTISELLRGVTLRQAAWLIPVIYLIHFGEEVVGFVPWARRVMRVPYSQAKFLAENAVLFAISLAGVLLLTFTDSRIGVVLVLSTAIGFLLNVFFHGGFVLFTKVYSPGTTTAVVLFGPTSVYLVALAAREGRLDASTVLGSLLLGGGLLPAVVFVVHGLIDRRFSAPFNPKKLLVAALPLVIVPLVVPVLGEQRMTSFILYSAPILLLPLVVKLVKEAKTRRIR